MIRTLPAFLGIPVLAGLLGVAHAQGVAPAVPMGQLSGQPAVRQALTLPVAGSSPVFLTVSRRALATPGGVVQGGRILRMTPPPYPAAARQFQVSGVVTVEAWISRDGRVVRTSVLRGPYSLRQIAEDSVRGWRYEPSLLDGHPVERVAQIDLTFLPGRY